MAWIAAAVSLALGAGSLLLLGVFLWRDTLGFGAAAAEGPGALAWDAALCLAFFVQHSGMVRQAFRKWLGRRVVPHWHGLIYTAASGLFLLALLLLWQPSAIEFGRAQGAARWAIRAVFLLSLAGFGWAVTALGETADLFGLRAARAGALRAPAPEPSLLVRGPYLRVRHPFYASGILMLWASPTWTADRLLLCALWTAWIVAGAHLEERDLVAQFGPAYRTYQQKVPMLVPRLRVQ